MSQIFAFESAYLAKLRDYYLKVKKAEIRSYEFKTLNLDGKLKEERVEIIYSAKSEVLSSDLVECDIKDLLYPLDESLDLLGYPRKRISENGSYSKSQPLFSKRDLAFFAAGGVVTYGAMKLADNLKKSYMENTAKQTAQEVLKALLA